MVHMNAYYIYCSNSQDDQSIHSIGSLSIIGSDMSAIDPHEYDDLDTLSQMDDSDLQPVGHGHHVSTPVFVTAYGKTWHMGLLRKSHNARL